MKVPKKKTVPGKISNTVTLTFGPNHLSFELLPNMLKSEGGQEDLQKKPDMVNNPQHYVRGGIEVIEVLEKKMAPEAFKGFLMGNVLKYVLRHEYKGGTEDLKKSRFYLERMIQLGEQSDRAGK